MVKFLINWKGGRSLRFYPNINVENNLQTKFFQIHPRNKCPALTITATFFLIFFIPRE